MRQSHFLLVVQRVLIERDRLECLMCAVKNRPAGRFVHTATLDTNQAILYQVFLTHAMLAADYVQLCNKLMAWQFNAVDGNGLALDEIGRDEDE